MRNLKIPVLLAVAAAAMMVFAASAMATTLTSPTGSATTPTIHATNEGGHVLLHNAEADIECASTFEGHVTSHGGGVTAEGVIDHLTFTGCTGGWAVTVNSPGSFAIHHTSGYNGTLTSSGMTITATLNLIFFHITCRYRTSQTDIGTITGGNPATIHLGGSLTFHGGSAACTETAQALTGNYVTTESLWIDP